MFLILSKVSKYLMAITVTNSAGALLAPRITASGLLSRQTSDADGIKSAQQKSIPSSVRILWQLLG